MSTERRDDQGASTLHVACMPFPTAQGTQAIVGMMLRALRRAGHRASLLTYAHGEPAADACAPEDRIEPLRVPDFPRVRSTRSGPSLGKVALDLRMVAAIRRAKRSSPSSLVVAHNVEAAWAAAAAGVTPFVYYAHTSMRDELPHYVAGGSSAAGRGARWAGDLLDRGACARAAAVFALTPALQARLQAAHARVECVPPPFEAPAGAPPSRADARAALHLRGDAPLALYAGNLDAYQGVPLLLAALREAPPEWRLLVASESSPDSLRALAAEQGVAARVLTTSLAGEAQRALVHAAADVALVPRLAPGGLPIKLLDALARGVPVVASRRALAGLSLDAHVQVARDDDAADLARAMSRAAAPSPPHVARPDGELALRAAGFDADTFVPTFERACERALLGRRAPASAALT